MKYYFTADYHLDHANIIKYCNRPFNNVVEMDDAIIKRHNDIVNRDDIVLFLGDFSFGDRKKFRDTFNGKFIFIKGNHDSKPIIHSIQINYGGMDIYLTHNPKDYNPNFDLNLVGHVHEKWKFKELKDTVLINIGVDQWNFKPVTIGDIHRTLNENDKPNLAGG